MTTPEAAATLPAQIGPYRNRVVGLRVMPVGELQDNPRNWRQHPPAQAEALEAAMRRVGVIDVVRYNEPTGRLWDGHLRKKLFGADPATPVVVLVTDLSEEEEALALATFDPLAGMALADTEALQALLRAVRDVPPVQEDETLRDLLRQMAKGQGLPWTEAEEDVPEPEVATDRAAELQMKWQTARGQVWEIPSASLPGHRHRLMCGDSANANDLTRLMAGQRADLLLTDPPYGINVVKGAVATVGGSKPVTIGSVRARRPYPFGGVARGRVRGDKLVDATLYRPVHGDDQPFDPTPLLGWAEHAILFGANYYASRQPDSRCWIVWDKDNTGHFADAELAWTDFDRGVRLYRYTWNGLVRQGSRAIEGVHRLHPTQKPVGLMKRILEDFSEQGALVADLYLGSGSVMLAAELTGRRCVGMEIEPAYVAVTLERLTVLGLQPVLLQEARETG
ncbi:MAG: hypothetical protein KatS3mg051_1431 [Anaerolineae bacterium]|nr:MAG: hypothetical protein KatS3mg051_1431 [Anaerolineae bacterium]